MWWREFIGPTDAAAGCWRGTPATLATNPAIPMSAGRASSSPPAAQFEQREGWFLAGLERKN